MIAQWMLYAQIVALGGAAVGFAAEHVARLFRWPTRWAWAAVIVASLVGPAVVWVLPASPGPVASRAIPAAAAAKSTGPAGATDPAASASAARRRLATVPAMSRGLAASDATASAAPHAAPGLRRQSVPALAPHGPLAAARSLGVSASAQSVLLVIWVILSLGVIVWMMAAAARLIRRRRAWREREVDGRLVLISADAGPAVVGAWHPRIVLPTWALALDGESRALMLRHEEEHVRAGDPRLIHAGLLALAVAPWLVALWWQVRRMRFAIEVDCDARVLRGTASAVTYGQLLLDVGQRLAAGCALGTAAAFSEPASFLEQRIRRLVGHPPRAVRTHAALWGAGAGLAIAGACATPRPARPIAPARAPASVIRTSPAAAPETISAARSASPVAAPTPAPEPIATPRPLRVVRRAPPAPMPLSFEVVPAAPDSPVAVLAPPPTVIIHPNGAEGADPELDALLAQIDVLRAKVEALQRARGGVQWAPPQAWDRSGYFRVPGRTMEFHYEVPPQRLSDSLAIVSGHLADSLAIVSGQLTDSLMRSFPRLEDSLRAMQRSLARTTPQMLLQREQLADSMRGMVERLRANGRSAGEYTTNWRPDGGSPSLTVLFDAVGRYFPSAFSGALGRHPQLWFLATPSDSVLRTAKVQRAPKPPIARGLAGPFTNVASGKIESIAVRKLPLGRDTAGVTWVRVRP